MEQLSIRRVLRAVRELAYQTLFMLVLNFLKLVPPLYILQYKVRTRNAKNPLNPKHQMWTFGSWEHAKVVYGRIINDTFTRRAFVGSDAPNCKVVQLKDGSERRIMDFMKAGRPLVLNFGSCTCPYFMAKLDQFNKLVDDLADCCDFLTIYIAEIHPVDGWAFKDNPYVIPKHLNVRSRMGAAGMLADKGLKGPLAVDTMTDEAGTAYAANPNRLVMIGKDGRVAQLGGIGPFRYILDDVRKWVASSKN